MSGEKSLEIQVKTLEKGMGTLVKAFKNLKASVQALEDKVDNKHNEEIKGIRENQKMLEDLLKANSESIKKIDNEILEMKNENGNASRTKAEKKNKPENRLRKCKFFNSGYCKFKSDCKFSHPVEICKVYLEGGKCDYKLCNDRHPKVCKWLQGERGCKRIDCEYLHVTLALDDGQVNRAHKYFPCAGCKNCFDDISCVVQHELNTVGFNLCLNCDSWIKHKENVLTPGWSIFDKEGYLRRDV
jgi:hypothetical protein